jgi:hypothetical protein
MSDTKNLKFSRWVTDNISVKNKTLSKGWQAKSLAGTDGMARLSYKWASRSVKSVLSSRPWWFLQELMNHEIINLFWYVCLVYALLPVLFLNPFLWNILRTPAGALLGYDSRSDYYSQKSKRLKHHLL